MQHSQDPKRRTAGWMGLARGHRARPGEWLAEKVIFAVSLTAILVVFLIFLFVTREALPVVLGTTTSSASSTNTVIPPEKLDSLSPDQVQRYLGLTPREYAAKDRDTLVLLMELKAEVAAEAPTDKDAMLDTTAWRYLLGPHQWTGYDRPVYIWQPVSGVRKFNIVPLIVGSLKTTLVALLFAVPLALGAALYVSQLAPARLREWLKPGIEMLAGIPSVVLGFFALIVMATVLQGLFGIESRLNAFVAGIALGLACLPVIFSIAEDALTSVPRSYSEAALALGSSRWQAAWQIVLPAAVPGVFAAIVLGFGRAIGETMVVLMASGNASLLTWSPFDSSRTLTATIAAELAETVFGGTHYRVLFLLGALLFAVTFLSNLAGDLIMHRLKRRLEGRA
jgi:phosphate transport system permease protein